MGNWRWYIGLMIAMIKSFSRRPTHVLAALALLAAAPSRAEDFDYYLLALSWSPTWCAGDPDRRSSEQCDPARDLGFTLHGLWPQYDAGGWPQDCHSRERDATRGQTAAMADIMGTGGLAWYQWKKHGRCSGLSAGDYFDSARLAYTLLSLPEPRGAITAAELERDFIAANPGLDGDEVIVTCRGGQIQEVRICLTTGLEPRACSRDVLEDACRSRGPLDVPDPP